VSPGFKTVSKDLHTSGFQTNELFEDCFTTQISSNTNSDFPVFLTKGFSSVWAIYGFILSQITTVSIGQNFKLPSAGIECVSYLHVVEEQYDGKTPSDHISHSSFLSL
jgi:hypothetical protein